MTYPLFHLFVVLICAWEVADSLRNPRGMFAKICVFLGLGTIHGWVPIVTPRYLMWPHATDNEIDYAAMLALIGLVCFSVSWRLYERGKPAWDGLSPGMQAYVASPAGKRALTRLFLFSLVLGTAGWLGSLIASAGSLSAALEAGRFQYRGKGNLYLNVILTHLSALMLVPPFIGFYLSAPLRWLGIVCGVALATMLFISTQGGRAFPLAIIGSILLGYAMRYRMSARRFLITGVAAAFVLMMAISLYEVRKVMTYRKFSEVASKLVDPLTYEGAITRDPLNYHQFLVAAVHHFPRDHDYLFGATYWRLLVFYLPQKYFEFIKPVDTNITFASVVIGGKAESLETTVPPTMMGDGYINFWGFPGVLVVMILNGFLLALAARKMRENLFLFLLLGPAFFRFVLLGIRGQPYDILTSVISEIGFLIILAPFCGIRFRATQRTINHMTIQATVQKHPATRKQQPARVVAVGVGGYRPYRAPTVARRSVDMRPPAGGKPTSWRDGRDGR